MAFARLSAIISIALATFQVASGAVTRRTTCSTGHVTANAACCVLFPVVDLIQKNLFEGGECGEDAHSALRLSFHDAIGFSLKGGMGGGADGSILAFNLTETELSGNGGTDDIIARQWPVFKETKLSAGDFVHLAAAIGTGNCPGAPRLKFMFGRPAPKAPAPDLTVPLPTDKVSKILARFADAGFSPQEVVALLASHTIAAADAIDPTVPGTPFDSTVGTFDSQVFLEVLIKGSRFPGGTAQPGEVKSALVGEMRLASDFAISQDPRTACFWQDMINNQKSMTSQFFDAMAKLQVLGQDTKKLIDCTDVVPIPKAFKGPIKYPASYNQSDLRIACTATAFPSLATVAGPIPTLAPVPPS